MDIETVRQKKETAERRFNDLQDRREAITAESKKIEAEQLELRGQFSVYEDLEKLLIKTESSDPATTIVAEENPSEPTDTPTTDSGTDPNA